MAKLVLIYQDRGGPVNPFPNIGGVFGPFDDAVQAQQFADFQSRRPGFEHGAFSTCELTDPEFARNLGLRTDVKPPASEGRVVEMQGKGRVRSDISQELRSRFNQASDDLNTPGDSA
jgi:hypothetical protein